MAVSESWKGALHVALHLLAGAEDEMLDALEVATVDDGVILNSALEFLSTAADNATWCKSAREDVLINEALSTIVEEEFDKLVAEGKFRRVTVDGKPAYERVRAE